MQLRRAAPAQREMRGAEAAADQQPNLRLPSFGAGNKVCTRAVFAVKRLYVSSSKQRQNDLAAMRMACKHQIGRNVRPLRQPQRIMHQNDPEYIRRQLRQRSIGLDSSCPGKVDAGQGELIAATLQYPVLIQQQIDSMAAQYIIDQCNTGFIIMVAVNSVDWRQRGYKGYIADEPCYRIASFRHVSPQQNSVNAAFQSQEPPLRELPPVDIGNQQNAKSVKTGRQAG